MQLEADSKSDVFKSQRHFSAANKSRLVDLLKSLDTVSIYQCLNANNAYDVFIARFTKFLNECCPLVPVKTREMKSEAWYDAELKEVYKLKQSLYKKLLRKPSEINRSKYCKVRNKYDRLIKSKKQCHFKQLLEQNKRDLKAVWHIL